MAFERPPNFVAACVAAAGGFMVPAEAAFPLLGHAWTGALAATVIFARKV